jgi:hypothetical protein
MNSWRLTAFQGSPLRGLCNGQPHAFGVDDFVFLFAHEQIVFSVWVTFGERKWSILAERRRLRPAGHLCLE